MDRLFESTPQTRLGYIEQFVDSMLTILYTKYGMDLSHISDVTWRIMQKVVKKADPDKMLEAPVDENPRYLGMLEGENALPYDDLPINEKKIEIMVLECALEILEVVESESEVGAGVEVCTDDDNEDDED